MDVPVYDPQGNYLPYQVSRVFIEEEKKTLDLLGRTIDGMSITSSGSWILFSTDQIVRGRTFKVTLTSPRRKPITQEVFANSCQARWSIVSESLDQGADSAGVSIRGYLSGCQFSKDWWIRLMPMFGGQNHYVGEEGHVRESGFFDFGYSAGSGDRHLMVIGRGKEPIKVIPANIVLGGPVINLGIVDLKGFCGAPR